MRPARASSSPRSSPSAPPAIEGSIKPGDKLLAINGEPIGQQDVDKLLEDTVNHRTVLSVETSGKTRDVILRPIASTAATGLLYRQWVDERRAYVERISGGRIGYVHMNAMGDDDLQQLYLDLDAQNESKQGVIVDVRNNNGGYINGYALDVFTRRNYLEMTPRDGEKHPSRQSLGPRAPSAFPPSSSPMSPPCPTAKTSPKATARSSSARSSANPPPAGSSSPAPSPAHRRLLPSASPGTEIQDLRGQTMEMHPRPVDVEVDREEGETEAGTPMPSSNAPSRSCSPIHRQTARQTARETAEAAVGGRQPCSPIDARSKKIGAAQPNQ